ncbi:MAG: YdeI/OmpD-associated family protein [Chitinophagaceae bacterium]|nr:YdeI/OmpD-associated family protein [Chitinophagaceae bacterium]
MELKDGKKTFYAKTRIEWRKWLTKNGQKEKSVWLIIYHKKASTSSVYYDEAVEEALCFGWIDSKPNKRDDSSYYLFFSQRKPKSNWSDINKKRVAILLENGLITQAGMDVIQQAKENGAWNALDEVSEMKLPEDLINALRNYKKARQYFQAFPASVKKGILEWIHNAKGEETRKKRIEETAKLAARNIRANQYQRKPK